MQGGRAGGGWGGSEYLGPARREVHSRFMRSTKTREGGVRADVGLRERGFGREKGEKGKEGGMEEGREGGNE